MADRMMRPGPQRYVTVTELHALVARASVVAMTNASGDAVITFARAFAAGVTPIVVPALGDDVGATVNVLHGTVTNTGFACRVRGAGGAPHASLPVRINYVAMAP